MTKTKTPFLPSFTAQQIHESDDLQLKTQFKLLQEAGDYLSEEYIAIEKELEFRAEIIDRRLLESEAATAVAWAEFQKVEW